MSQFLFTSQAYTLSAWSGLCAELIGPIANINQTHQCGVHSTALHDANINNRLIRKRNYEFYFKDNLLAQLIIDNIVKLILGIQMSNLLKL